MIERLKDKQLTDLAATAGKTVEWMTTFDQFVCILFSDATFIVFDGEVDGDDAYMGVRTSINHVNAHNFGLISLEERNAIEAARITEMNKRELAWRRQDYERLRKEFGEEKA